ncbi:MAG: phage holin family protein [Bacteroidales bacterium]|nr:phage holin family protein [Candidatus Scybalousia scybalohippi]
MSSNVYNGAAAGFGAVASAFVIDAIGELIPWLITMTTIIFADLVSGIFKSYKLKEKIRFSKAVRDSMAKFCTYYSVCVCACFTQIAAHTDINISRDTCLIVCGIEAISIIGNILHWHGYSVDFRSVIAFFFAKKFGTTKDVVEDMITEVKQKI